MISEFNWLPIRDGDPRAYALYRNHYSFNHYQDGRRQNTAYRNRYLICGPGQKMLLLTQDANALFDWGGLVHIRRYGTGTDWGFPFGHALAAVHYQAEYTGATSWSKWLP